MSSWREGDEVVLPELPPDYRWEVRRLYGWDIRRGIPRRVKYSNNFVLELMKKKKSWLWGEYYYVDAKKKVFWSMTKNESRERKTIEAANYIMSIQSDAMWIESLAPVSNGKQKELT